jgi:hypothetical protein
MKTSFLKKMFLTALLAVVPITASAAYEQKSETVSLSSTPTHLSCSSNPRFVTSLRISTVPGGSGKVYVGTSGMNTSTGAELGAVLYPNSGAQSETFDTGGGVASTFTYDLCEIYVAGTSGEKALVSYTYTDIGYGWPTSTHYHFHAGAFALSGSSAQAVCSSTCTLGNLRVQVLPGQSGKVAVGRGNFIGHETDGTLTGVAKVLWPNSGTTSQHNAWSESFSLSPGTGYLDGSKVVIYPFVTSETPLLAYWSIDSMWASGLSETDFQAGSVVLSSTPTVLSSTLGYVRDIRFSVVPGYCNKVYVGNSSLNTSTLAGVGKVLYPTSCSGGWSEEYSPIPHNEFLSRSIDANTIYLAGTSSDVVTWWALGTSVVQGTNYVANAAYAANTYPVTLSTTPTALGSASSTTYGSIRLSVVPGTSGKVYIGSSAMNTSTLAGVAAILYPNSSGSMSEEFELKDILCGGIDLSNIYVAGGVSGEQITISLGVGTTNYFGDSPCATSSFTQTGLVTTAGSLFSGTASTNNVLTRVQVVPGGSGKVRLGFTNSYQSFSGSQPDSSYASTLLELWPNTGSSSVGEAWSENFLYDYIRQVPLSEFKFYPAVSGEGLLVGVYGR